MKDDDSHQAVLAEPLKRVQEWHNRDDLNYTGFFPILAVILVLSVSANYYVGDLAIDLFSLSRWVGIGVIACLFLLGLFLMDLLASFAEVRNYRDHETGNINVSALWKKVFTNPLNGLFLICLMTFGVTSAQSLSEYYRVNVTTWYDAELWVLEAPLFDLLKGSLIDIPKFWDTIYLAYWPYLMLVYCALYRLRQFDDLLVITIATILSYFLTRWLALQFPTAGPAFYQPELFNLVGTTSSDLQKELVLYMSGKVSQSGFIPGTMGMPSLHVSITLMSAYFLAQHISWTLLPLVAWICLTWLSTIMLGWHYILDGVGGILVALFAVLAARAMLMVMGNSKHSIIRNFARIRNS